jgi:hypothetical protein
MCDASSTWPIDNGVGLDCRRVNVTVRVFAPSMDMARAMVTLMIGRINIGLH